MVNSDLSFGYHTANDPSGRKRFSNLTASKVELYLFDSKKQSVPGNE